MLNTRWFWEGKRVTVMGLGLLGRGVGDVAYIASQGAEEVVVTDMKTATQLEESLAALAPIVEKYKNIRFVLGGHREENFVDVDMVIHAAGVPKHSLYTELAREHGIPVHMSTALAAKWCMESDVRVVGVTGTRGKSTVSQMIYEVLKKNGVSVHLGGNIRGVSTLQLLTDIAPGDTLVMELDSWQLQGFGELTISPNIAVFTNLMPDHMNYYKSMDEYFEDKAQIFAWQRDADTLICGQGIAEKIIAHAPPVAPIVPVEKRRTLKLIGEHNQENAALAAAALRACGLGESEIEHGLSECEPVEGRLQYVKDVHGIKIYNDNNASTPEATLVAIASVKAEGPVTLIWGGSDKGTDMHTARRRTRHIPPRHRQRKSPSSVRR
jgi:UDP-N-acetylmuramoylalanine--D-glutamate ligase